MINSAIQLQFICALEITAGLWVKASLITLLTINNTCRSYSLKPKHIKLRGKKNPKLKPKPVKELYCMENAFSAFDTFFPAKSPQRFPQHFRYVRFILLLTTISPPSSRKQLARTCKATDMQARKCEGVTGIANKHNLERFTWVM